MTTSAAAESDDAFSNVPMEPGVDFVRVRFAGDSGDGIQLTGTRFAESSAAAGNDFATFPDYPAEIRAPAGTTYGVSSYSINIGRTEIQTFGDQPDVLVALNPAALKTHIADLRDGGLLILDSGSFDARSLAKAGYEDDPRGTSELEKFKVMEIDISALTLESVADSALGKKDKLRCKNMWTLGLVLWMFGQRRTVVTEWLTDKFKTKPDIADANIAALNAGHAYGETVEVGATVSRYDIPAARITPGEYRTITGSESLALGLAAATKLSGLGLFFASYPITPASPLLHLLAREKQADVTTFQAEDEIAAICAAIGASYAGKLGVTSSSGPGLALKTEALGLAIVTELPLIVIDVQRGGPSTGLPTKTEQSDLLQAMFGRNGDAPVPVIAASHPGDCFACAVEAARIATTFMTPVILLSDGYIANVAEPWLLPDIDSDAFAPFPAKFASDTESFHPYRRDSETLARNWAVPGMEGFTHRIGGLEKDYDNGNVSYLPANHQRMTDVRVNRIANIANFLPEQEVELGPKSGRLAILGWGSTYGPIRIAALRARVRGQDVAHIHLRNIWPLPRNLEALLDGYDTVLVPEMNTGQLSLLLRSQFDRQFRSMTKVTGQPFKVAEITAEINAILEN